VLVNGAAGGVGMLVVQIAKAAGAEVTGVDRTDKLDLMKTIGVDHVVDYTSEDFTTRGPLYDLVVDIPGNRSFGDLKRAMAQGAGYVLIGHDQFGSDGHRVLGSAVVRFLRLGITAPFGRKRSSGSDGSERKDHKEAVRELVAAGRITPVVDPTTFGLGDVPAAIHYMEQANSMGKIIITIS
jgi:NADPH:quinone reductase-like Zn-dependent oxidoreductase